MEKSDSFLVCRSGGGTWTEFWVWRILEEHILIIPAPDDGEPFRLFISDESLKYFEMGDEVPARREHTDVRIRKIVTLRDDDHFLLYDDESQSWKEYFVLSHRASDIVYVSPVEQRNLVFTLFIKDYEFALYKTGREATAGLEGPNLAKGVLIKRKPNAEDQQAQSQRVGTNENG